MMKSICEKDGTHRGIIADLKTYERVKNGKADWKDHIKPKLKSVIIPFELFERLMNLDKEKEC